MAGFGSASRRRGAALSALVIVTAFFLFNSAMRSEFFWLAGTSFGPRYLVPTIPFAAAGLAFAWQRGRNWRLAIAALAVPSILFNWLGALAGAADAQSAFPLFDRFLPSFLEHGPEPSLVRNLGAIVSLPPQVLVLLGWGGSILVIAAGAALLRPAFRIRPDESGNA